MKEKQNSIKFTILAIILISIFCFAVTPITFQNDTFYTIKIGEHIANNGIDMKDPFSWHSDLNYTYPHWLYDLLTYFVYSIGGFKGIYIATIILTIILGITLFITSAKLTKTKITSFILTIGIMYVIKDFIAARAQLVTFTLFVLTVYFIEMFLETTKKRYAVGLVVIPILIANLHVAVFPFYFVLYLPYIAEYLAYLVSNSGIYANKRNIKKLQKSILKEKNDDNISKIKEQILKLQEKQSRIIKKYENNRKNAYKVKIVKNNNIKYLVIIMIICLFTGLFTPIGFTPYTYLIKTMLGNTTHNISEHLPLVLVENLNLIIIVTIFLGLLIFTDTKIRLKDLFMLAGLLFLTFYSKRQESIFALICVGFILNKLICDFCNKYSPNLFKKIEAKMVSVIGTITITVIIIAISLLIYKPKINNEFVDEKSYPVQASNYILDNLDINNIRLYNEYNFGSYLLFRGIPVFIDSRADLYSPEFNKDIDIFTDFLKLDNLSTNNIESKLDKYGITHLIMSKKSKLRTFIKQNKNKYSLLYEDDNFCIYERTTL